MAKRDRRSTVEPEGQVIEAGATSASHKIEDFAGDLGRLLGTARAKAEGWLGQRQNVAKQLEQIRDTAAGLLNQLTGMPERRRPGRSTTAQPVVPMGTLPGKRPKRKVSANARAAMSLAQKARWAAIRKAAK